MSLVGTTTIDSVAGDTVLLEHTITHRDTGLPANITGDTVRMSVRRNAAEAPVLTTADGTITVNMTNPGGGIFTTKSLPVDTAPLLGPYVWQCELEDALNNKQTVARGHMNFTKDLAP